MFSAETRLVAGLSILALTIYFPAAWYLGTTYVSDMAPAPPGATRQIFKLEKYGRNGIAYLEKTVGYRHDPNLIIYEDDRPLITATGLTETNTIPGRFAQEVGLGIALSATDGSDVNKNKYRYWIVRPAEPR